MSGIRFGCQTYSWQMSYELYKNKLGHIIDVIGRSGYEGVEAETCMLGGYYDSSDMLKSCLAQSGLSLGALCLVLPWRDAEENEFEKEEAEKIIKYLEQFPGTLLSLCQYPGDNRDLLRERRRNALRCVNAIAARAYDRGITCAFHPNSPAGSVFRTEEDYKVLFDGLDQRLCGFAADTGHIAKGGMDVVETFKIYRPFINHVHYKDMAGNGVWALMGEGVIDFKSVTSDLASSDYNGWIMVEDESPASELDPDAGALHNIEFVKKLYK